MAYAVIEFIERGEPKATICRPEHGQPTGADGVMEPLAKLIEDSSPAILREGSPGAERMAMVFVAREQEANRDVRVLGADGPLGISPEEVKDLDGQGYFYRVDFGRPGERSVPSIHARGIGQPS
ncbi:MAG TPA: hypothetical protein VFI91_00870 [Longimicrobiaceae bacterium]|nr:hypothetical protein [Longimicrobiaceae bacterium]